MNMMRISGQCEQSLQIQSVSQTGRQQCVLTDDLLMLSLRCAKYSDHIDNNNGTEFRLCSPHNTGSQPDRVRQGRASTVRLVK